MNEVLPLFYTAMQLDPEFAFAHAMAAWCHFWRKINGRMTDWPIAEGVRFGAPRGGCQSVSNIDPSIRGTILQAE